MASLQDVMVSDLSMEIFAKIISWRVLIAFLGQMEATMIIPAEFEFKPMNKLNDKRCGPAAKIIGDDALTVEGVIPPSSAEDEEVACVQAVEPFKPEDKYGYFEVTVLETCGDGQYVLDQPTMPFMEILIFTEQIYWRWSGWGRLRFDRHAWLVRQVSQIAIVLLLLP